MKNIVKMSLALALVVPFVTSCSKEGSSGTTKAAEKMTESAKEATAAAKSATDSAKSATEAAKLKFDDMKAAFAKSTEGAMGDIGKEFDSLKTKAAALNGEQKNEMEALVKNITAKKDEVVKMFSDMKGMSDSAGFTEMKGKLEMGMADLKKMVETAMAKLK